MGLDFPTSLNMAIFLSKGGGFFLKEPIKHTHTHTALWALHSLFHTDIAPPWLVAITWALVCKHVLCIAHLPPLANLPANLATQLQLHGLAGQKRVVLPRTITLRHSSGRSDEFA